MIFVTVGTHEDGFERLVREMDRLVEAGEITDEVVYQLGYTRFRPARGQVDAMLPFDRVQERMRDARVIVSHGGPASIMQALAFGKTPVVVPRQSRFREHVDDHQVRFAQRIADRVVVVTDIATLGAAIHAADARTTAAPTDANPRAVAFARRLDTLCEELSQAGSRRRGVLRWPR